MYFKLLTHDIHHRYRNVFEILHLKLNICRIGLLCVRKLVPCSTWGTFQPPLMLALGDQYARVKLAPVPWNISEILVSMCNVWTVSEHHHPACTTSLTRLQTL